MPIHLDHLTVTCSTLALGEKWVTDQLGVRPQSGGEHPKMGTHNLLLKLGDQQFLEVIAPHPTLPSPNRPRWFDLDSICPTDPPKLAGWVARTQDIDTSLAQSPQNLGAVESMARGDYQWLISIPPNGKLVMHGCAPSLIQWQCAHPASKLQDLGCRLLGLEIHTPQKTQLHQLLNAMQLDDHERLIHITHSDEPTLVAKISTPHGVRFLGLREC